MLTSTETNSAWGYTLDNARTATQALTQGQPATDTLTVHSDDGTAYTFTVNLTATSATLFPYTTLFRSHAVIEAGGVANATPGDPSASGTLHVSDVDAGQ